MIYLDNAATSFPKPEEVYKALDFANRNIAFNAGRGESKESLEAFNYIKECREEIAILAKVEPCRVVFTDSATGASNIIISGISLTEGDTIYISPFEHNAICRVAYLKKQFGVNIEILKFDSINLQPDLEQIQNQFAKFKPSLVCISEVSNVTGTIINFSSIFELSKKYSAINVLDSSQSFGLISHNYQFVDYQIFAGHKTLYSSFGVGGFIVRGFDSLKVTNAGGTGSDSLNLEMSKNTPQKFEFGSPNVVAIYGLLASVRWINKHNVLKQVQLLTNYLYDKISKLPNAVVYGMNSQHIGIISFNIEGYNASDVGSILSEEFDISVRTGYHCAPLIHDLINSKKYNGTIRVSLNYFNTKKDIDCLVEALKTL